MATELFRKTTRTGSWYWKAVDDNIRKLTYSSNAYDFILVVTLNSQDVATNTSNITCQFTLDGVSNWYYSGYYGTWTTSSVSLKTSVTGEYEQVASKSVSTSTQYGTDNLGTYTGNVQHDDQGNLSIMVKAVFPGESKASAEANHHTGMPSPGVTIETDWLVLPTNPRAFKVYGLDGSTWRCGEPYVFTGTEWKKPNVSTGGVYGLDGSTWRSSSVRG